MDFSVAVLSGLGGGHLNNLAGAVLKMCQSLPLKAHLIVNYLDHDESSFAESRALHGEGGRSSGISASEIIVLITHLPIKL